MNCECMGWICPKCEKSISPHVKECNCDEPIWQLVYVPFSIPTTIPTRVESIIISEPHCHIYTWGVVKKYA